MSLSSQIFFVVFGIYCFSAICMSFFYFFKKDDKEFINDHKGLKEFFESVTPDMINRNANLHAFLLVVVLSILMFEY